MKNINDKVFALLKKCWLLFAMIFIAVAILFTCFRALTPWANQYKGEVEKRLSQMLGKPVHISGMETSWYWFEPVLKLENITISDAHRNILKLNKLLVGINLFSSLLHWQVQPGVLFIEDVQFDLKEVNGHWEIDGLGLGRQVQLEPDAYLPFLSWLFTQQKIILKNIAAKVHFKDGSLLPIQNLDVTVVNQEGHYHVKGRAKLAQTVPTHLTFLSTINMPHADISQAQGEMYVSVSNLLLAQWQSLLPDSSYQIEGGEGDMKLWLDFASGKVQLAQAMLSLRHMALSEPLQKKNYFIQSLKANLAWKPVDEGWQLAGDHIHFQVAGMAWPENKLLVKYREEDEAYSLYLQSISLDSLFNLDLNWPDEMHDYVAAHPFGTLQDTQLHWINHKPAFFLTRFHDLGLKGSDTWPQLSGISGVFSWEPEQGRLELDSHAIRVVQKDKPPLLFSDLNSALDWKFLSNGLRLSLDRFVLVHPDLVLTARGRLDDALKAPALKMEALYSAKNGQNWLQYIPSGYLKLRLENWLKKDIKRVGKASGRINVDGPLADFPFDNDEGEFTILTYLSDMDLRFNHKWSVTKSIDAELKLNKRSLEVDVFNALFEGIDFDQVNLRINDVGLDREVLLVHSKNQAPSEKFRNLVLHSPLKKRLSKLNMLDTLGPLGVEFRLEIPLYPQNTHTRVWGELAFLEDEITFHHSLADLTFKNLSGSLQFDEKGVVDSAMKSELLDEPVDLSIRSFRNNTPSTEVRLKGQSSLSALKKRGDFPLSPVVWGHLNWDVFISVTDDTNDFDHLQITTDLKGTKIDLPQPLGKQATESTPLTLDVAFNPKKSADIRLNYHNKLSTDILLKPKGHGFDIERGEIRLGSGKAFKPDKKGLRLIGSIEQFDLEAWQNTLAKFPSSKKAPAIVEKVNYVDLELEHTQVAGITLKDLIIQATRSGQLDWGVRLKQPSFKANLFYQGQNKLLSGHFDYIHLPELKHSDSDKSENLPNIRPGQLPGLNLTIGDLKVGALDLGNVIIKGQRFKHKWHLEYCKLISPYYQLSLAGDWVEKHHVDHTKMQAYMKISDLAGALGQWHIAPVVEARRGEIQFQGGWAGPIYDFSLENVTGDLDIKVNNGRITKLSPETEEKLGLGKLLSILSLQTIPRRLTLDFSDLAKGGYSFDIFKGKYQLQKGIMKTSDSYIDGPVAYAGIKGSLDLKNRLYDLDLHVAPHITASLPVVATIAGGPIAGIATWVASKLINQSMQKISGYTYKVTGPWLDPVVQQVKIIRN